MLQLIHTGAANVIGYSVDGKVEAADIEHVYQKIRDALETEEQIRMYAVVHDLHGVTLKAFLQDLARSLTLHGHLARFEKVAVVSNRNWLQKVIDIGDILFPGIDVQLFSLNETEQALAWVRS